MRAESQPPEISENQATGEIAEIFADIRRSFEAPIVNQIYRRIAGIPGCLNWAWSCVGPLVGSGDLEREASDLLVRLRVGEPIKISRERLCAVGINDVGERTVNRVLDAYNRTNPMNLISVQVLVAFLGERRGAPPRREYRSRDAVAVQYSLPALVDLASMDAKTRQDLLYLARQASGGSADVIPTLFQHFGEWPGFLALARDAIAPLSSDDKIGLVASELVQLARGAASNIAHAKGDNGAAVPAPSGRESEQLDELLTRFTFGISRMIVIGHWLRLSMPR